MPNPIRPTDDQARQLARDLIANARFAALGVLDGAAPMVTRIAFGLIDGRPASLISDLSHHTRALKTDPACSLLLGEPESRGDPLTHPRLTLQARARLVAHDDPAYAEMAAQWLRDHPKARLYVGFADFRFVVFDVTGAYLNGGFGRAFVLTPADLDL